MNRLVLLRHGESEWNEDGRFAGWIDVPLTTAGIEQAKRAGSLLRGQGFAFSRCYTSVLRRAIHTAWHCLDAMDCVWLRTLPTWRLNERHYGALHGLSKSETAAAYGEEQTHLWRRSYGARPPPASPAEMRSLAADPRYASAEIPAAESMQDTVARVASLWDKDIYPSLLSGADILVVAHGTSIRALLKIVLGLSESCVAETEIPNALPLVLAIGPHGKASHCQCLDEGGLARFLVPVALQAPNEG